jgi:FdrA protein
MSRFLDVRRGAYHDSVSLMQVSQDLQRRPGVSTALVAMATELNLALLDDLGFDAPRAASPNDLVVAVETSDDGELQALLEALDEALARRPASSDSTSNEQPSPSTVAAAARRRDADLVLVSTPGRVAVLDAVDALDSGLDVMIFSDNVSVEHEIALKRLARERGRLVMGPDCGTAVVSGVGLGFANVVRPGPVGVVAASGTGAQHLMTLLDSADIGVTHCLGVGGRDLSAAVGGLSTMVALERLGADPGVELIVVLSKPPAPGVAAAVAEFAAALATPVVMGVLGPGRPNLTQTAASVAAGLGVAWQTPRRWGTERARPRPGYLRGLFSGGTLCDEAMLAAADRLGTVVSNIPLAGQPALDCDLSGSGHIFIDFGDDQLTVGRPHPMIDATLRLERLKRELADPDCAVVLLDVVLGHGAHPDPAAELAAAIAGAAKPVVVSLVGTRDDPQGHDGQAQQLAAAGAVVHASNAAAADEALSLLGGTP